MSQSSGIPSFTANAQWQTARMDRDLQTFSAGFVEQSIYHRPGRAVPKLLTATQDAVRAARRGRAWRLMARWSSIMTNATWWFSDSAARLLQQCKWRWWSSVTPPAWVTGKTCEWHCNILRMFCGVWKIWSCIVLNCSQQTVARLWQRSTLTNTSFNCGEQIVSTLILSNVCLSFIGAAHEKFSDTAAMPEVTSRCIFSSYEAVCSRMLKRVTGQKTTSSYEHACVDALFMCVVWERVCQCGHTCVWYYLCQLVCVYDHVRSVFDDGAGL